MKIPSLMVVDAYLRFGIHAFVIGIGACVVAALPLSALQAVGGLFPRHDDSVASIPEMVIIVALIPVGLMAFILTPALFGFVVHKWLESPRRALQERLKAEELSHATGDDVQ